MIRPSEDELIARYFGPLAGPAALGLHDDVGLLALALGRELVVTMDALVAGVHFFADDLPASIARKALRVNLSDLAAKASRPLGFLLALVLPPDWTTDWLEAFSQGLGEDASLFACPLIGGDTVSTPGPLTLSITMLGEVETGAMLRRTGARPGDRIYVSGTIGDAALGLQLRLPHRPAWEAALLDAERAHLLDRYLHPQPRLALRAALGHAHAGMDVSDGLIGDLAKMLRVSGVTARVELASVPLSKAVTSAQRQDASVLEMAVTGGDDYEILATVPPERAGVFETEAARAGVPVTVIGEVLAGHGEPSFVDGEGQSVRFARLSYSHA